MSKKNNSIRIFFAILMFASIAPGIEVLAETTNMDTVVLSTTEILAVSLDVGDDNVKNGNFEEAKELTKEQKGKTLESHLLLARQSDDSIKGRMVANGSKQRSYTDKDTVTSPTCATESLLLTSLTDAKENRDY